MSSCAPTRAQGKTGRRKAHQLAARMLQHRLTSIKTGLQSTNIGPNSAGFVPSSITFCQTFGPTPPGSRKTHKTLSRCCRAARRASRNKGPKNARQIPLRRASYGKQIGNKLNTCSTHAPGTNLDEIWPYLVNLGPIRARLGQTTASFCQLRRPAHGNDSQSYR